MPPDLADQSSSGDSSITSKRKQNRLEITLAWVLAAVLILYSAWRLSGWAEEGSGGAGSAPQASASQPTNALNHKALINDENFHILQGMAYGEAGLLDQAIAEQMEALRVNARSGSAWNNIGFYYFQKGKYVESARALEQALQLTPNSELVQNNLRNTYDKGLAAAATEEEKQNFRTRKEKLESGGLVDFLRQVGSSGKSPNK